MEEEEENKENIESDLQLFFNGIIGTEVDIIPQEIESDEDYFDDLLMNLEESINRQDASMIYGGIDLEQVTGPLWYVLENYMNLIYGEEAYKMIMWYLLERWDEEGNVKPWIDIDNKEYKIENRKELWKFIHYNFLK